jgi:bis(5'-nucleosyl)-tetraphosphatase (symmetrical)
VATYAVGDIQGCYDSLVALLERVGFQRASDRLWLVGDLVNRGPKSLAVLRFLADLGDRATCVLGNHDLHLIARHCGVDAAKDGDTLDDVLDAQDADVLIDWLVRRPLLHRADVGGTRYAMVHAGLHPAWTVDQAAALADGFAERLTDPTRRIALLETSPKELRTLITLRTCHADGTPCKHKGPPEDAPKGCLPWFAVPGRRSAGEAITFGHWSALGFRRGADYLALDTGCVWGGTLTAVRLDDGRRYSEPARERPR